MVEEQTKEASKQDGEEEEVKAKKVVEQSKETGNIKVHNLLLNLHLPTPTYT